MPLASFDHPNIAQWLDGGHTEDDLPYFVMEYIDGLPIDVYCDTNKLVTKDSVGYRSARFITRHKVGVIATALIGRSLIAGLLAIAWPARVARTQRELAVRAASVMIYALAQGLEKMIGPTESRLALLSKAAKIFDAITATGLVTPELFGQGADANRVLSQTYRIGGDRAQALH